MADYMLINGGSFGNGAGIGYGIGMDMNNRYGGSKQAYKHEVCDHINKFNLLYTDKISYNGIAAYTHDVPLLYFKVVVEIKIESAHV